jgi:hypothetical protein
LLVHSRFRYFAMMHWERRVAAAWTDTLRPRLRPDGIVVELAPGFGGKIAHGLATLDFRGTVIVIEPNDAARQWATAQYRRLLPRATVMAVEERLPDAHVAGSVDALIGNHVLDDLLLDAATADEIRAPLFTAMHPDARCAPRFIAAWRTMLRDRAALQNFAGDVARATASWIEALRPRFFALNDYRSWRHRDAGLAAIRDVTSLMIRTLQRNLQDADCAVASSHAIDWLIGAPHAPR